MRTVAVAHLDVLRAVVLQTLPAPRGPVDGQRDVDELSRPSPAPSSSPPRAVAPPRQPPVTVRRGRQRLRERRLPRRQRHTGERRETSSARPPGTEGRRVGAHGRCLPVDVAAGTRPGASRVAGGLVPAARSLGPGVSPPCLRRAASTALELLELGDEVRQLDGLLGERRVEVDADPEVEQLEGGLLGEPPASARRRARPGRRGASGSGGRARRRRSTAPSGRCRAARSPRRRCAAARGSAGRPARSPPRCRWSPAGGWCRRRGPPPEPSSSRSPAAPSSWDSSAAGPVWPPSRASASRPSRLGGLGQVDPDPGRRVAGEQREQGAADEHLVAEQQRLGRPTTASPRSMVIRSAPVVRSCAPSAANGPSRRGRRLRPPSRTGEVPASSSAALAPSRSACGSGPPHADAPTPARPTVRQTRVTAGSG